MPHDPITGSARLSAGRVRLELELPIAAAPPPDPAPDGAEHGAEHLSNTPPNSDRPTHAPDFAAVCWYGTRYTFTPKQRSVVAALWRAWQDGYEYVGQDALLEVADSDQVKLRDLFRGHPAWQTMIVSAVATAGAAGAYRLNVPRGG